MPDEIKLDKDQYTKSEVQAIVDESMSKVTEKLEVSELVGNMTDIEKSHYSTLTGEDKDTFLFASAEERGVEISKKMDSDPVIYTATDGTEIRKSDGAKLLKMAKDNDENSKKIAKLYKENEDNRISSFIKSELQYLPGAVETQTAIVKAVEGIPEEATRIAALDVLKAQNAKMSKSFVNGGTTEAPSLEKGNAEEELENLVKTHMKDNPGVAYYDAYDAVATAHQDLYTKAVGGQ